MKSLPLLMLGLALPTALYAQDAGIDPANLSRLVQTLSSDDFEGRGPATAGEEKTVAYLIEQFKAAGLQPGGDLRDGQRQWTQDVPLGRFRIDGPLALSIERGGKREAWTQGEQIAVRAAMTGQKEVSVADAPMVFVGYGVSAPERQWDDFKGVDLRGKIAIVLVNDPDFETGEGDFSGKGMTYYGRWTYKYEEAARRGALGMLVVHETEPASYGWATVKNSNTNAMFDIVRQHPEQAHVPIEGWIQREVAVDLFRGAGLDFEALKKQAQTRDFKPVTLAGTTFSARYDVDAQVITSHNVLGLLPGAGHPDETVIFSGHWDHLGVGAPDADGDRIYNGAVDNATGIAGLVELARVFAAGPRPDRSLVFLAVTAEEKGLLGSEYYGANPVYPLATTAGVINIDALDPNGPARNFSISGSARLQLIDDLIATAGAAGVAFSPDGHPEAGYFFRSDHFSFAKRGVPAVSFESGDDWIDGGKAAGEAEREDYNQRRYHQPADQWRADWSFTGMARDLAILHTLGGALADSRRWPNWAEDSEFRAARDASAAQRN